MKKSSIKAVFPLSLYLGLFACDTFPTDISNELNSGPQTKDEIIFETDFTNDLGYIATNLGLLNTSNVPTGWTAVRVTGNSSIEVINEPGIADKPVLKLSWDPDLTQPTVNLLKHLTGDISTGYNELYIRYHVRLPANFRAGDGKTLYFWKWGRLWQNTASSNPGPGQPGSWTENRDDSYYVVWNFATGIPYTDVNAVWGANSGRNLHQGSAGGERYFVDYFKSGSTPETQPGYFESVGKGNWDIVSPAEDSTSAGFFKNKNQKWHTIEYHFKLASSQTANDGIFEVFFDGHKQVGGGSGGDQGWTRIQAQGKAQPAFGIPTAKNGSGFNMFSFFDNIGGWNSDFGAENVDGFIYVNDVVISGRRIGHEYIVGSF